MPRDSLMVHKADLVLAYGNRDREIDCACRLRDGMAERYGTE